MVREPMTLPLTVRPLVPDDAAGYRELMLDAYTRHPEAFTSSAAERVALPLDWWMARIGGGPDAVQRVFGAFVGTELAGAAGLTFETREKTRHKATLFGMYVAPASRQRGLGRALVDAALAAAHARPGVLVVQLTVTEGNDAARALYERCGFVAYGVEPLATTHGDGYLAKVHMWRRLDARAHDEGSIGARA